MIVPQAEVPQHRIIQDCGVYTMWFVKQLALGFTDISLSTFTPAQCDLERLTVANRLSAAIHADPENRDLLASIGVVAAENQEQDKLDEEHQRKSEAIYPLLPSTDVGRAPPLEEWRATRHKRRAGYESAIKSNHHI